MIKVLIIGQNSYIGNSFSDFIKQHNDILTIKTGAADHEWESVDFAEYDCVLHVAAVVHRKETSAMEQCYYDINCDMALAVAQKAKQSGVGLFVFLSSMAVFGDNVVRITNDTIPAPNTYYGKSKLKAEQELRKLESEQFKLAIVRPPIVYGKRCKGNFKRFVMLARLSPVYFNYSNKRSMIYIDNLSKAITNIILNQRAGIFHVQNSEYIDTSLLFRKIRALYGKQTFQVTWLYRLLASFLKRITYINKIIGNYYYDYAFSNHNLHVSEYSNVDFEESLEKSLEKK